MSAIPPVLPDYELIRAIGSGSYGEVWLARSLTGLWRAIKVVRRDRFADARPFERELAGITRFQQSVVGEPRQLALLHVGELPEGGFYYVMELADDAGGAAEVDPARYTPLTLKELQRRRGRLPAEEAVGLSVHLARALATLHARGLVHRDVKPSNVIFVQGLPKLADVGLVSSAEQTITSVGTPAYLPPEGAGTPRGDVYSLGKILYELATGEPSERFPVLPAEMFDRPDRGPALELNAVSLQAAETDPTVRYADAGALLADLVAIQAGASVRAFATLRRRFRRLARAATGIAAIAAGLVALFAVLAFRGERARRQLADEERAQARYTADLRAAAIALAQGDQGGGKRALRRHLPGPGEADRRGFEWFALDQSLIDEATRRIDLPGTTAVSLEWSEDGRSGLIACADGTLREFSGNSVGEALATNVTRLVGRSPSGDAALLADRERGFIWLPIRPRDPPTVVAPPGYVGAHWPGRWACSAHDDGPLRFSRFDLEAGRPGGELAPGPPWGERLQFYHVALDGAGSLLAATFYEGDGIAERYHAAIWSFDDRRPRWSRAFPYPVYYPHLSRDGRWLAHTEHLAGIAVRDTATGETQATLIGHLSRVDALAFSPDGALLASGGGDQSVRVWDWRRGVAARVFRGCEGAISALAWRADGRALIAASEDRRLRVFDLGDTAPRGAARVPVLADARVGDVVLTPDGERLMATTTNGTVAVCRTMDLAALGECRALYQPLFRTQAGEVVGLGPGYALRRQQPGQTNFGVLHPGLWPTNERPPAVIGLALGRRLLILGGESGQVRGFDLASNTWRFQARPGTNWVMGLDASARLGTVACGDDRGNLLWLDAETGAVRARGQSEAPVQMLRFSPDGRTLMVARADAHLDAWTFESGPRRVATLTGHSRYVYGLAYVDQGSRLVTAGSDGKLIFWRTSDYRPMAELTWFDLAGSGGDQSPYALAASDNGRALALMTQDGWLRVWRRP